MKEFSRFLIVLLSWTWLPSCATTGGTPVTPPGHGPVIRVLLDSAETLVIQTRGGFQLGGGGGAVLARSNEASTIRVANDRGSMQFHIDPQRTAAAADQPVFLTPLRSSSLSYKGKAYPGRFLMETRDGTIFLINVLPLETYLEGVLPHEIGDPGPDAYAALEAQAITARTYASKRMEERSGEPFDVHADIMDQEYGGIGNANRMTTQAVRETRGWVLTYNGELCTTYYSATCGGHTSDIRFVWPDREAAPYLFGSYDRSPRDRESYCAWVHNFRWRYSFSGKQLGVILRRTIPAELGVDPEDVGSLVDLEIAGRTPSGRVGELRIFTTKGRFSVRADRIRWVLRPEPDRILPSTLFNLYKTRQGGRLAFVSITGGGNGHGVGMCQNGAIGMARKGYSYRMILAHYYPGTKLERRY